MHEEIMRKKTIDHWGKYLNNKKLNEMTLQ